MSLKNWRKKENKELVLVLATGRCFGVVVSLSKNNKDEALTNFSLSC